MAGKTNYLEGKVLDLILNATAFSAPTPYVGLFTAAPTDAGGGTEVSGGSYARVDASANFPAASGTPRSCANDVAITFPTATADWGTCTHFGIFDAASAGNLLYWAALTASKTVQNGDTASFAIGALTVTED